MPTVNKLLHWMVRNFEPITKRDERIAEGEPVIGMRGYYQNINRKGTGALYLRRHFLGKIKPASFFLHWFASSDQDEWVHDHPWRFCISIVLSGWYVEDRVQYLDPFKGYVCKEKKVRWLNFLNARTLHRVKEAKPGTWTLLI